MVTWSELGGKSIVFFYWYLGVTYPTVLLIAKSWFVVSFYLYFTVVSFDLSRSRPYTYPSSTFRWFTFTSKARPQTFTQIWSYINLSQAFYPMPDTAFVFIYFQAAEAYKDRARCFRCFELGHLARDCTSAWSSPRNVYRGIGILRRLLYFMAPMSPILHGLILADSAYGLVG